MVRLAAGDDRVLPPVGPLQEPPAACGEVVRDLGLVQPEVVEVDDVEIGAVPGGDDAPVEQPDGSRRVVAMALHEEREVDPVAVAVAAPVLEQRRREAAVADRPDVSAAVAQAWDGVRVGQHLVAAVE